MKLGRRVKSAKHTTSKKRDTKRRWGRWRPSSVGRCWGWAEIADSLRVMLKLFSLHSDWINDIMTLHSCPEKDPLTGGISMQRVRGGNKRLALPCARANQTMRPLLKGSAGETLYLPSPFDPSPLVRSLSLLSLILSHILPLRRSSDECGSVSDPCSGATHTHPSADVLTVYPALCVSLCVCVLPCMWVTEAAEYWTVDSSAYVITIPKGRLIIFSNLVN